MWDMMDDQQLAVSIHAPARGATWNTNRGCRHILVSIHAPARGATHSCGHCASLPHVSIHAPARGATGCLSVYIRFT